MAFTLPARYSITVRDELGTEASMAFYALLDPTKLISDASDAWQALATVVDPIQGGVIVDGSITIKPAIGGFHALVAGSRVEQTGIFNMLNNVDPHRFGVAIPALADTKIVAGKINLVDAAVAALITFLGAVLVAAEWVTNHQAKLTTLRDALISFRKRRRQLSRSSFEL